MAKTRQQKEVIVTSLTDNFGKAKSVVFVNFDGLTVSETGEFRKACREAGLSYAVAKKTLLRRALDSNKLSSEIDIAQFQRGVGSVFGFADEVTPAQVVDKFSKAHEAMTVLGGAMLENPEGKKFLSIEQVNALAKLPTRDVLLGKLVGSLNAPISGFVRVLAGNMRGLVTVLNGIKEQKA
jgi:large subunit ribosomal protein L10